MTTIKEITAVGIRLEEAATRLGNSANTPKETYDLYEMLAIQILDSEYLDFQDNFLEQYLLEFLAIKRERLGLD